MLLGRGSWRARHGHDQDAPPRVEGLPAGKTFDVWDEAASAVPAATQRSLRTLEWLGRAEEACLCGPSGAGKSHLVEALGHLAIDQGKTVAWHTLESLTALVRRHRADDTVSKAIGRLIRADLIVIDDVGMLPVSLEAAEALFRVVDAAYERRSLAIAGNLHPSGFDELMPKTLAAATVDRLLHHAHVLVCEGGESYRLAQATRGHGVTPLTTTGKTVSDRTAHSPTARWQHDLNSQAMGNSSGRPWGISMATSGEFQWPPLGRNRWPLTHDEAVVVGAVRREPRRELHLADFESCHRSRQPLHRRERGYSAPAIQKPTGSGQKVARQPGHRHGSGAVRQDGVDAGCGRVEHLTAGVDMIVVLAGTRLRALEADARAPSEPARPYSRTAQSADRVRRRILVQLSPRWR